MEFINKNPIIYIITGKARHGKTTSARFLKKELENMGKKVAIASYGEHVKDYAKNHFGWDGCDSTKPRELLQTLGTDLIRGKLGKKDFFVNRMIDDIEILSFFFDVIIIDDARLEIEVEKPKSVFDNVITIRIVRDNFDNGLTKEQLQDITETGFDHYDDFDYYIHNDGTLDDLNKKLTEIVRERNM